MILFFYENHSKNYFYDKIGRENNFQVGYIIDPDFFLIESGYTYHADYIIWILKLKKYYVIER